LDEDLRKEIRKIALQNAYEHDGKTKDKLILSKFLANKPEFRNKIKDIINEISSIVSDINQIPISEQKHEIESEYPELLRTTDKKQEKKVGLPPLENAQRGEVVTRFPPEPNGYPHIGHAKAAIINEEYAKMYDGKLILRFDDTNPENERLEFFAAIKVGLDWLQIKFDQVKNTSDDMELLYNKGQELINNNFAYICTCKQKDISKNRREMVSCKCSQSDPTKNHEKWHKMFEKYKPGEAIVRFRGDMKSQNTVMRDPVLFRILDARHPIHGNKYRVWPNYDFAVAIEDSIDGVTHAFRSKEYELRNELFYAILDLLKMRKPKVLEFSRLEFEGMPVSKRIIKPLLENGKISWYDDPRLPTLEAFKKRGITPEAIRKFVLSLGLTKSDTLAPFDALESFNRKIIDSESTRLYMVINPKKLSIHNLPITSIELANHPTKDMGKRKLEFDNNIYLSTNDISDLTQGSQVRLMGLGNVEITKVGENFEGEYKGDVTKVDFKKIQWIPQTNSHKIKIIVPKQLFLNDEFNENSLEELDAYTEPYYLNLKDGAMIQFVRFGYCRKDSANQAIYTHK